jgi:hypothetical protein
MQMHWPGNDQPIMNVSRQFIGFEIHVEDQYIQTQYLFLSIPTELLTFEIVFSCSRKTRSIPMVLESLRCVHSI